MLEVGLHQNDTICKFHSTIYRNYIIRQCSRIMHFPAPLKKVHRRNEIHASAFSNVVKGNRIYKGNDNKTSRDVICSEQIACIYIETYI